VGSISPRKGIQDAVRAFADPGLSGYELRVAGAGSGSWVEKLKDFSPKNVSWLGQIPPDQTARELAAAWCLVLPTRCDTSPNVVKEARVIGLPVITTPQGGQSNYIEDGENGFLVPPGDISALTRSLGRILSDLKICQTMGAARHSDAREHFRPQRTAELFLELYRGQGDC